MQPMPTKSRELAELLAISTPYAHALLNGDRLWTQPLAIALFRKTGHKVGPIANASDADIDVLGRFPQRAA